MGDSPLDVLGVGRWPSVSVGYRAAAGSSPALDVALRFEAPRYAGARSPGPTQDAALTDMQTLARAHHELGQVHPDGTPGVSIAIVSSLDSSTPHVLGDTDRATVRGLALDAWRSLRDVVAGTAAPRTDPITAIIPVPIAATNAASIFELTVSLLMARDPSLFSSADRDGPGVARAAALPLVGDRGSPTDIAALVAFATAFEQAYTAGDTVLKVGVDATRTIESPGLWVVRTSATPKAGAIGCEVTGPPVFWAPPPLSREPISRTDVEIWPFDAGSGLDPATPQRSSYSGVDVDTWARQALEAIETLLLPRYRVPAFVLDVGGSTSTSFLDRLRAAKASLAASIAGTVQCVLTMPPAPTDRAAIADAQDAWRHQLLATLSSAYAAAAAQLPVTLSGTGDGGTPPALGGHPIVAAPKARSAGTSSAPPCSLSAFRISATGDPAHLTFLVTATDPGDQAYLRLDLGYRVDQVEHQCGGNDGSDGQKTTVRLTFPNPMPELALSDPELATLLVPIVLRACPGAPSLAQRSAPTLDHTNAKTLLRSAATWTYVAEHTAPRVAQDVTYATAWLHAESRPAPTKPPTPPAPVTDVFAPLARLLAVLPELNACFDADLVEITPATDPSSPQFTRAGHALAAFTTLVEDVAATWAPPPPTAPPDVAGANDTERTFAIAEMRYPAPPDQDADGGDQLLETITPDPSKLDLPGAAMASVVFDGYQPVPTGAGVRYQDPSSQGFLTWSSARSAPGRSVAMGPLEVFDVELVQFGMRVVRNAALVPGNPTLDPFVTRTPLVTFASPCAPSLSIEDPIDVAGIATGVPAARPLVDHLRAMFATFFAAAAVGAVETVELEVAYHLEVVPGLGPDVPVSLLPRSAVTVPADWSLPSDGSGPPTDGSSLVFGVAQFMKSWIKDNQVTADGQFVFDLAAFSPGSSTLPLVRLSGLTLRLADVTDL